MLVGKFENVGSNFQLNKCFFLFIETLVYERN